MSTAPGVPDGSASVPPAAGGPTPPRRTGRRVLVVALVVAAAVVVAGIGVVVLSGGSDGADDAASGAASDGGDQGVEGAAASLERMIDDPTFFSNGDLASCPLGDIRVVEDVVAEHGDVTGLSVREQHSLNPHERMQAATVLCSSRSTDEASLLEVFASRVPDGDYAFDLNGLYLLRDLDVDRRQLEGGDLYVYCATHAAYPQSCGADWVHGDDLVVGIYGEGLALDADGAAAVLEEVRPDLLASLARAEAVYVE